MLSDLIGTMSAAKTTATSRHSTGRPANGAIPAAALLISALVWWITHSEAANMGLLMRFGVPMSIGMEGWADLTSFAVFTGMWAVMMVAMMLPSSYATFALHRTVYTKRFPHAPGGALGFPLSYFLVWSATGSLFYGAYVLIGYLRSSGAVPDVAILRIAGAGLTVAGVYQWTPLKQACLKHCQTPMGFLINRWRDGRMGAARMGAEYGVYCFGCCWGLMLVLFTMGVMHLGWMVACTIFILVEKLIPAGAWLSKLAGFLLLATGLLIIFSPQFLTRLSSHITIG